MISKSVPGFATSVWVDCTPVPNIVVCRERNEGMGAGTSFPVDGTRGLSLHSHRKSGSLRKHWVSWKDSPGSWREEPVHEQARHWAAFRNGCICAWTGFLAYYKPQMFHRRDRTYMPRIGQVWSVSDWVTFILPRGRFAPLCNLEPYKRHWICNSNAGPISWWRHQMETLSALLAL